MPKARTTRCGSLFTAVWDYKDKTSAVKVDLSNPRRDGSLLQSSPLSVGFGPVYWPFGGWSLLRHRSWNVAHPLA